MLVHDLTFKPHNDCKTSPYDYHDHCEHKPRSHLLSQLAWDLNKDRGLRICPLSGRFACIAQANRNRHLHTVSQGQRMAEVAKERGT